MTKSFYSIVLIGMIVLAQATGVINAQWRPGPEEIFDEAREFFSYGEYEEALELFLSLLKKDEGNDNLRYLTGACYMNIEGRKHKALPYLEEASKNISLKHAGVDQMEKKAPAGCLYYLGLAYRLAYRFDESLETFSRLKKMVGNEFDTRQIDREKEITRIAAMFYGNRQNLTVFTPDEKPADLPDHGKYAISGDESTLVWTVPMKFYDAVFFSINEGSGWSRPVNITSQLGSDGLAYPASLSWDGTELFLYQYDPLSTINLYLSRRNNGRWSAIEKLSGRINSPFSENHASVTKDGRTLYFSSNRLSGEGGFDIYRSFLDENMEWSHPENLGYPVNTSFDESYPFISPCGNTLYFSSSGHTGMGGLDIFVSRREADRWSYPRNPGFPLNTPDNDIFLIPVGDGGDAYYTLRDETGRGELVKISFPLTSHPPAIITGNVTAENGSIDTAIEITFRQIHPVNDTIILHVDGFGNDFEIELPWGDYLIDFNAEQYQAESHKLSIPEYYPDKKYSVSAKLTAIETPDEIREFVMGIEPVLFGFDRDQIDKQFLTLTGEVAALLNTFPDIKVELLGFTDAIGPAAYNNDLAFRRAKNVARVLITGGVDEARIILKAVGMGNYIARNTTPGGHDNPEGRKYNRRVEFNFINLPEKIILENRLKIPDHLKITDFEYTFRQ
jgi:outer membrane protein OmpA-like peptidoglycan-associated protein/tetratricopeptide (TPR) repeat protein